MQRKRTPPIKDVISSAYSLCFAIGHHIDPVDVFELLHAGLDTAHQRPDFSTVQPNVDLTRATIHPLPGPTNVVRISAMPVTPGYTRRKARALSPQAGRNGWVKPAISRFCSSPVAVTQAPTRKSWLRLMSRRPTPISASPMSTEATP